jgi:uncharacterized protein YbbC (DUF1343 family)
MFVRTLLAAGLLLASTLSSTAQKTKTKIKYKKPPVVKAATFAAPVLPAAERPAEYLPLMKGKRVGLLVNQTSVAGKQHLADFLKSKGVNLQVIFGPEHGFRGNAPDGARIDNTTDPATGVRVISLYGKKTKPAPEDLKDIDLLVYDIQDVGARFYTYISSLQYLMEAALEAGIPLLVLDRPNPNGHYVDGPVLDPKFKTFVGMQPIPTVYGMTPGEYAQMILREGMLSEAANKAWSVVQRARYQEGARYFSLHVVPCANYTHKSRYVLPVRPSPNLPDMDCIWAYPSTCIFEGTAVTEGRGTPKPFAYIGHPSFPKDMFSFTPQPTEGAPNPRYKGQACYGWNLTQKGTGVNHLPAKLDLSLLLKAYQLYPQKDSFFRATFNRLAGSDMLQQQLKDGLTEDAIRASWEPALSRFKAIRKKYLLYPDFE